ncbi:MAG: 50S ribosomal protein L10 [Candidatus Cloacimonetes bacterium]|nr:50S ribosomal protein L10 [Candidatus Cloacimonadota bacterium]
MANELKVNKVQDLTERLKDAKAIVLIDFKGINIEEVDNLRNRMRNKQVDYFVSKNSFIKRALNLLGISDLDEALVGPTSVAVSKVDEIAPARGIAEFIKEVMADKSFPTFKVGYVDGKLYNKEELERLAKLPAKEQLIAMMLSGFNAPMANFVYTLKAVTNKFVYAVDAIAKR